MIARVALLTPYNGGNLGDAAIQDAMIANLRQRLPNAQFSGISLNSDNFIERHGMRGFPLCGTDGPFYRLSGRMVAYSLGNGDTIEQKSGRRIVDFTRIKKVLKGAPPLWWCLKTMQACGQEFRHWVEGYRFLRTQDLLIVSGGGQLNDRWGGPWHHPFALAKWAILARIAKIPYVIASVGSGKASRTSRFFLAVALRMAAYRSFRDKCSRAFATGLLQLASNDPVVPDLAYSLPFLELPSPAEIKARAKDRPTIAISLIAYAKPGSWPSEDQALYHRYLHQMTRVVSRLLERGYFLVMVCSSLGDDESVIPELIERLDDASRERVAGQMNIPSIKTWKDLAASLYDVDFLVSSRLHSAILGFVTHTPTVAISFDPKVDRAMEELGQTDYLFQIRDFTAEDVIKALDQIECRRNLVIEQIRSYIQRIAAVCALQYDSLAELAVAGHRYRN